MVFSLNLRIFGNLWIKWQKVIWLRRRSVNANTTDFQIILSRYHPMNEVIFFHFFSFLRFNFSQWFSKVWTKKKVSISIFGKFDICYLFELFFLYGEKREEWGMWTDWNSKRFKLQSSGDLEFQLTHLYETHIDMTTRNFPKKRITNDITVHVLETCYFSNFIHLCSCSLAPLSLVLRWRKNWFQFYVQ